MINIDKLGIRRYSLRIFGPRCDPNYQQKGSTTTSGVNNKKCSLSVVGVLLACNTVQGGKKKSKMIKETFNALQQFIPSLVYEPSLISF